MLVVENPGHSQSPLEGLLIGLGYSVHHAPDGASAFEKAGRRPYDLILTDARLPDMEGAEWVERVLSSLPNPKPPVIAVTAHDSPDVLERLNKAGVRHTLRKPIQLTELVSVILKATGAEPSQIEQAREGLPSSTG